jgi:hypothetical protein
MGSLLKRNDQTGVIRNSRASKYEYNLFATITHEIHANVFSLNFWNYVAQLKCELKCCMTSKYGGVVSQWLRH